MIKIKVPKAEPIDKELVEDAIIEITGKLERFKGDLCLKKQEAYFFKQAVELNDALHRSLPQGLVHQLLICMLRSKECLFVGNDKAWFKK